MDLGVITFSDGEVLYTSGPAPRRVSGITKLLQAVVVELKSDFDAVMGWGSDLPNALRGSRTENEARPLVVEAVRRAKVHVQQHLSAASADERLTDLRMRSIELLSNGWRIGIDLITARGRGYGFYLE